MKAEKIQKHMLRRTVVVGHDGTAKGVINNADGSAAHVRVAGAKPRRALHGGLYNGGLYNGWFPREEIRKATDAERAEFFAWLVSDGRDITDGFARFGGMPRGFEAWRAAQTPAAEPVADEPTPEPVADEPTPEPVVTPQHKVGDLRVRLTYDGFGEVGRIAEVDQDGDVYLNGACRPKGDVYDPTPENVARLVEQQRARGIVPELGDLVFVLFPHPATALVAHNVSTAPDEKRLQGVLCGGGAFSWGLAPDIAAHTLVIRRNPLRGVEDV